MASYTQQAPGDSFEPVNQGDPFLTEPTVKFIILEVFPLLVATFIIFMFLVVTLGGLTTLFKSIYRYNYLPAKRKFNKIYRRYKSRWGAHDNVEHSSSSSSSDSDIKAALELLGTKLDPSVPRVVKPPPIVPLNSKNRTSNRADDTGSLSFDPSLQEESKQPDENPEEDVARADNELPSDEIIRADREPVKRVHRPPVMPKTFSHLSRNGPRPAQRASAASRDLRSK